MTASRETIYAALFAQLQTAGATFQTYSRRWRSVWDEVQVGSLPDLPLLVQFDRNETVEYSNVGIGGILRLQTNLLIYAKIPQDPIVSDYPDMSMTAYASGSRLLNGLIDAIQSPDRQTGALATTAADGRQTLGGLVYDCRVEGPINRVLGDEDGSGVCGVVLPVVMLIP